MRLYFRQHGGFHKATGIWTTTAVKQSKSYTYIPKIQAAIISAHLSATEPLRTPRICAPNDPRLISATLCGIPKPPMEELVKMKSEKSRHIPRWTHSEDQLSQWDHQIPLYTARSTEPLHGVRKLLRFSHDSARNGCLFFGASIHIATYLLLQS